MSDQFQWDGLPSGEMYCWTWGKAPKYDNWNAPRNLFSLEQIKAGKLPNHRNPTAPTGFGMVSGRWSGTLAVDFDTKPERPQQAEETFRNVTGHASSDLPASATVVSGRPGRRRVFLRVPEVWWPAMSGYSAKLMDLELRWEGTDGDTGAPKPVQSVITGPHPDSPDWFFRWADELSPHNVGFQDAPDWLLIAIVKQRGVEIGLASDERSGPRRDEGPGYMDQLDPKRQRELLRLFSQYWPYRGGKAGTRYQASWDDDGFSALLGALYNVLGITMAEQWLNDTEWFDKNEDWGPKNSFADALRSVGKSSTAQKAGWGTLHFLATRTKDSQGHAFSEPGVKMPGWALPPKEVEVSTLTSDTAKEILAIEESLKEIELMTHPAQRLAALQTIARKLGKSGKEMTALLQAIMSGESAYKEFTANDLIKQNLQIRPAIQGLLARGCLTVLASAGGVAKTSVCYQMATAIAEGSKFAGTLQAEQGNVLIIQKDETASNAKQKITMMDLHERPEWVRNRLSFRFDWHPGMMPELKEWITKADPQPVAVFMDSLGTLLGGAGGSMNDAECALYLYQLNQLAAETDTAIVMTHHTKKRQNEKGKKDDEGDGNGHQRVRASDIYGSSYIVNAASDVWGLAINGGTDEEPQFALEVIKPRSGITQRGDVFFFAGNLEDLSFEFESFNHKKEENSQELTGTAKEQVLQYLGTRTEATAVTESMIKSKTGLNANTIKRVIRQLYSERIHHCIGRKKFYETEEGLLQGVRKGRPAYAYYCY